MVEAPATGVADLSSNPAFPVRLLFPVDRKDEIYDPVAGNL